MSNKLKYFKSNYLRKYSSQTIFYLLGSFLQLILSIILTPIFAKNLEPEDFSIIGYYHSFNPLLNPFFGFMLTTFYSVNYFKATAEKNEEIRSSLYASLLIIGLLFGILSYIGFRIYFNISQLSLPISPYFEIFLTSLILQGFRSFQLLEKKLARKARKYFFYTTVYLILNNSISLYLVIYLDLGAEGKLAGPLIGNSIFVLVSIYQIFRKFTFNKYILINALKFCWPLVLAASLQYFFQGIDRLFLEKIDNVTEFANYSIALSFVGYMGIFTKAISDTFEPDIFKSIAEKNFNKLLLIFIGIIGVQLIPAIISLLVSKPIFNLLTAGRYTEAYKYFNILIFSRILMSIYYMISKTNTAMGFPKFTLYNKLIILPFSVIFYYILIRKFEFYGAAYSQIFIFLLLCIIAIIFGRQKLRHTKR